MISNLKILTTSGAASALMALASTSVMAAPDHHRHAVHHPHHLVTHRQYHHHAVMHRQHHRHVSVHSHHYTQHRH
jgi:hypothetical protein